MCVLTSWVGVPEQTCIRRFRQICAFMDIKVTEEVKAGYSLGCYQHINIFIIMRVEEVTQERNAARYQVDSTPPKAITHHVTTIFFIFLNFFNIYSFLRDRDRQSMSGEGAEGGRHRIRSGLQAPSHQHRAGHGAWRSHEPWDHNLSQSRTLNDWATRAPRYSHWIKKKKKDRDCYKWL